MAANAMMPQRGRATDPDNPDIPQESEDLYPAGPPADDQAIMANGTLQRDQPGWTAAALKANPGSQVINGVWYGPGDYPLPTDTGTPDRKLIDAHSLDDGAQNATDNPSLSSGIAGKLTELLGMPTQVTASDPSLKGAIDANQLANQRTFERGRQLLAERAGAQGFDNSGGFDSKLLGLNAERGQNDAGFAGNLVANAQNDRTSQLLQAIQTAQGRENSNNQLGFNYSQLEAMLNAQYLQSLLNGSAQ